MSKDEQMQQATFHLVAFDEGGVKQNQENLEKLRLVCQINGSVPSSGGNSVVPFLSSPPVTQLLPESPGSCSIQSAW